MLLVFASFFILATIISLQIKHPRLWVTILCLMLSIWFIFGCMLAIFDLGPKANWISDWVNAAVAIGTIGVGITSLYLANRDPNRWRLIHFSNVKIKENNGMYLEWEQYHNEYEVDLIPVPYIILEFEVYNDTDRLLEIKSAKILDKKNNKLINSSVVKSITRIKEYESAQINSIKIFNISKDKIVKIRVTTNFGHFLVDMYGNHKSES